MVLQIALITSVTSSTCKERQQLQTQKTIVEALMKPQAYPQDPGPIELIQTHISYVFLVNNFVYKVKKDVNFGFLDFSTLEKRRFFCEKELQLNRRLCPEMYLEVVPINAQKGKITIGGLGETVEYALKMKRMPQEKIMTKLLEQNQVDKKTIGKMAKIITDSTPKPNPISTSAKSAHSPPSKRTGTKTSNKPET
jgi:aminoglycoside phosphotransferase family enzyme